jgi:hypothetical protein
MFLEKLKEKQYNNMLLVGSGFSLDFTDPNSLVDDETLVICVNAGISQVRKCDIFFVSNWYTFRDELSYFINPGANVLCDRDMSFLGIDFLGDIDIDLYIKSKLKKHNPYFFNISFDIGLLDNPIKSINCGYLFGLKGSSSVPFFLAYALDKVINFHKINYIGFDFAYIRSDGNKYYYPNKVYDVCVQQRKTQIIPFDYKYNKKNIKFAGMFTHHFDAILAICIDNDFKDKLFSYSLIDFNLIDNKRIKELYNLVKFNKNKFINMSWQDKRQNILSIHKKIFKSDHIFYNSYSYMVDRLYNQQGD